MSDDETITSDEAIAFRKVAGNAPLMIPKSSAEPSKIHGESTLELALAELKLLREYFEANEAGIASSTASSYSRMTAAFDAVEVFYAAHGIRRPVSP